MMEELEEVVKLSSGYRILRSLQQLLSPPLFLSQIVHAQLFT